LTAAGAYAADWASIDGAVAFRWTPTLSAGQSVSISTRITPNAPLVAVPEPAAWALLVAGLLLLGRRLRRR
jgi:hypothetical protein